MVVAEFCALWVSVAIVGLCLCAMVVASCLPRGERWRIRYTGNGAAWELEAPTLQGLLRLIEISKDSV